jgi:hypothetical protein
VNWIETKSGRLSRRRFLQGAGGAAMAAASAPLGLDAIDANAGTGGYQLEAYALGAADGAQLQLAVLGGGAPPEEFREVRIRSASASGPARAWALRAVAAPGGMAVVDLGDSQLLDTVSVQVLVSDQSRIRVLRAVTQVTDAAVNPRTVLMSGFTGFGGQMNMHLYTALNDPSRGFTGNEPPKELPDVEAKVEALKPGLVRIFLSPNNYIPEYQNRMDSFVKTVGLAHRAGAIVNITWWFLERAPGDDPVQQQALMEKDMREFADTLSDLVVNRGYTSVRQITLQNEVNTTWITPELYEQYYRRLDAYLRQAGLREHIAFVGGDLVHNNQEIWFSYLADHMGDVLDGWSVHIYWNYYQTYYMQQRLSDISAIYQSIDPAKRKPISITEYGVRGYKTLNGEPIMDVNPYRNGALTNTAAGYYIDPDGTMTPITQTVISAFQHAWFALQAVNTGFSGLAKWDLYRAQYDFSYQDHSTIGYLFDPEPGQERWPLRPVYYVVWLMANATGPGWRALGVDRAAGGPEANLITAFAGPSGEQTLFALSTDSASASFSIGNLPRRTEFDVRVWNGAGDGAIASAGRVSSTESGVLAVDAPAQSMVCLTTVPLPAPPQR